MIYKTIVLPYQPRAAKMAAAIEEKANEMARRGLGAGNLFRYALRQSDSGIPQE